MTKHFSSLDLKFYLTEPQPCPYLPGREERKIFTPLRRPGAGKLHDYLSDQGFRRSQTVAYRPDCVGCNACVSLRVPVADFRPGRTHRRILRRNANLVRRLNPPYGTEEQYTLFERYLSARHADGSMSEMDIFDFSAMIEDTSIDTQIVEYRDNSDLVAVCITDVLHNGLSMVYSFYQPEMEARSLGTFMILDHMDIAAELERQYLYLGYYVEGCRKMAYKASYKPYEYLASEGGWTRVD